MSDRAFLVQGRDFTGDGNTQTVGFLPGRGLVVGNLLDAFAARGLAWHVTVGALSTPIVGGGNGTVLDLDQPEFVVSVPSGYCMRPVRVSIQCELGIQTTDSHVSEILLAVDRTAAWAADGTSTAETPANMRTDIASGCPCSVASAFTADMTNGSGVDPVLGLELAREQALTDVQGTAATLNVYQFSMLYEPTVPPYIVGPAAMYGYWGGDIAVSGFAQIVFIAFPSSLVEDLS